MTPFPARISKEIRRNDSWTCTSCGKSSFEEEKWLLEASHLDHHAKGREYINPKNGTTECRVCHLLRHIDIGDIKSVSKIANRIWNTGLCHFSVYVENPQLMRDHRVQLSEMLSAMGLSGQVHIKEEVKTVDDLKKYVRKGMER